MAVQFESYNTNTTWTPAEAAAMFQDAFVDAGVLPPGGWFDSFTSGSIENRILRIEHDNTKTYGTTFYWFMFSPSRVHIHICTGWNTTTKLPTGSNSCIDHPFWNAPATNTTAVHHRFATPSSTVTLQLLRYTSAIDPTFTWFVLKNGASEWRWFFHMGAPTSTLCDLNRSCYLGMYVLWWARNTTTQSLTFSFAMAPIWIRRLFLGSMASGATQYLNSDASGFNNGFRAWSPGEYGNQSVLRTAGVLSSLGYLMPARRLSAFTSPETGAIIGSSFSNVNEGYVIRLPLHDPSVNPAYTAFESPIWTGLPYSMYSPQLFPADIGFAATYNNNTIQTFDKYIVTPGTNEWEVIAATNGTQDATMQAPSGMILARTAG